MQRGSYAIINPMNTFDTSHIRNFSIVAHIDHGKSTISDRILELTHTVEARDLSSQMLDSMDIEQERGITIKSNAVRVMYDADDGGTYLFNLIDTPGHVDFTVEVERSMRVLDGAVMVYCAVGGVQPQSETVWRQANKYHVPRIAFVNKMDRTGANFLRVVEQIKSRLKGVPVPVCLPIGKEDTYEGVVDLLKRKAIDWDDASQGVKFEYVDIPADMKDLVEEWRGKMVDAAAEANDTLMEKYLENGDLSEEEILQGLRERTLRNEIIPVTCGSAFKNKGVQFMLDCVVHFLPSPEDVPPVDGKDLDGNEITRKPDDKESFSALAFKLATDPFVGNLTFLRCYSGVAHAGDTVLNSDRQKRERFGRLVQMHANHRAEIKDIYTGDIVAAIGLKETTTGDTLCDPDNPIILESMVFPDPVISVAVEPKTKADQEKMSIALNRLAQEDPSFRVRTDEESGQTIISGMGELHLDIIVDRMRREFSVDCNVGKPQVAYRETIKASVEQEGKFVRQSGGRGQYGHCWLRLEPQEPGKGYEFVNAIVGGVIPKEYIPAIDKGVQEQMENGVLAGFPVVDVKVTVFDGSFHEVDSSEMAFKIAGSMAFKAGFMKASPVLLEPLMKVEVETPEDYMGDVIGDLNRRRAIVEGMEDGPMGKKVHAMVPLGEMFGYATDLRSQTQGRASYTMEFGRYAECPRNIADAVISERQSKAKSE